MQGLTSTCFLISERKYNSTGFLHDLYCYCYYYFCYYRYVTRTAVIIIITIIVLRLSLLILFLLFCKLHSPKPQASERLCSGWLVLSLPQQSTPHPTPLITIIRVHYTMVLYREYLGPNSRLNNCPKPLNAAKKDIFPAYFWAFKFKLCGYF